MDNLLQEKIAEYNLYIEEHITNVKMVWKLHRQLFENPLDKLYEIDDLIRTHDESKFSKEEFDGYRRYFYPVNLTEKCLKAFALAWNHHQKTNPHHWQYWIMWLPEGNEVLEMPFEYVMEMLCDWTAMSLKFKNKVSRWYADNKSKMLLNSKTIELIEALLPKFDMVLERLVVFEVFEKYLKHIKARKTYTFKLVTDNDEIRGVRYKRYGAYSKKMVLCYSLLIPVDPKLVERSYFTARFSPRRDHLIDCGEIFNDVKKVL